MNYVTPYKYAQLCGVTTQAIYRRLAAGLITKVQIPAPDGSAKDYIDIDVHPPERLRKKSEK